MFPHETELRDDKEQSKQAHSKLHLFQENNCGQGKDRLVSSKELQDNHVRKTKENISHDWTVLHFSYDDLEDVVNMSSILSKLETKAGQSGTFELTTKELTSFADSRWQTTVSGFAEASLPQCQSLSITAGRNALKDIHEAFRNCDFLLSPGFELIF